MKLSAEKILPEIGKSKRGGTRSNSGGARIGAGRPAGRPNKVTASVREVAQTFTEEAVQTLASVMRDTSAPAVARVSACNAILDRAHGRPTQGVELEIDNKAFSPAEILDLENLYETAKRNGVWIKQKAEMQERKRRLNAETSQ